MTESGEILTLTKEERGDKVSYRITGYKEKCSDEDIIEDEEIIKGKLFNKDSEESKNITVFPEAEASKLYNTVTQAAFSRVINLK